jgi:biotin-dependent carboxylase-like uncharacterized protein
MREVLEIVHPGSGMSLQDSGRPGLARFGVPPGGWMDPFAARLANELVGNPSGSTSLEVALQGGRIRLLEDLWLAWSGAASLDLLEPGSARFFPKGTELAFRLNTDRVWGYLSCPGGFLASRWFGSTSASPRSGIGSMLQAGDRIQGEPVADPFPKVRLRKRLHHHSGPVKPTRLRIRSGPQRCLFPETSSLLMTSEKWRVSSQSDRTGYRLSGAPLPSAPSIPSEPVLPGAIQVPPDGAPIVTMVDGPTVGGYPKIAQILAEDLVLLAQSPPGKEVCFRWID